MTDSLHVDDGHGSNDNKGGSAGEAHELLLGYMRGELTPAQHATLVERLDREAALRDELESLYAVAALAQDRRVEASADASFARLNAALNLQPDPAAQDRPRSQATAERISWLAQIRRWLDAHSMVLQPALIALVLVQAGVIVHFVDRPAGSTAPTGVVRGSALPCGDLWVTFKGEIPEQTLRSWLTQYGATIVAGPDGSGRYRIRLPDEDSRAALLHAGDTAQLTLRIDAPDGCASK